MKLIFIFLGIAVLGAMAGRPNAGQAGKKPATTDGQAATNDIADGQTSTDPIIDGSSDGQVGKKPAAKGPNGQAGRKPNNEENLALTDDGSPQASVLSPPARGQQSAQSGQQQGQYGQQETQYERPSGQPQTYGQASASPPGPYGPPPPYVPSPYGPPLPFGPPPFGPPPFGPPPFGPPFEQDFEDDEYLGYQSRPNSFGKGQLGADDQGNQLGFDPANPDKDDQGKPGRGRPLRPQNIPRRRRHHSSRIIRDKSSYGGFQGYFPGGGFSVWYPAGYPNGYPGWVPLPAFPPPLPTGGSVGDPQRPTRRPNRGKTPTPNPIDSNGAPEDGNVNNGVSWWDSLDPNNPDPLQPQQQTDALFDVNSEFQVDATSGSSGNLWELADDTLTRPGKRPQQGQRPNGSSNKRPQKGGTTPLYWFADEPTTTPVKNQQSSGKNQQQQQRPTATAPA